MAFSLVFLLANLTSQVESLQILRTKIKKASHSKIQFYETFAHLFYTLNRMSLPRFIARVIPNFSQLGHKQKIAFQLVQDSFVFVMRWDIGNHSVPLVLNTEITECRKSTYAAA